MELQKPKSRLVHVETFPDFDGLGLYFSFSRWYCLHAESHNLKGNVVMESVVRRSGALLHSYISLHETVFLAEDLSLTHGLMTGGAAHTQTTVPHA